MFILYNLLQVILLLLLFPFIAVKIACTPKYRQRILGRLGFRLSPVSDTGAGPRIWVHALSVGEVISSVAFTRAIRNRFPTCTLVYSTSTLTGASVAVQLLQKYVDSFVVYPLDLLWSVRRVINGIRPDIFILIETDLWPNMVRGLYRRGKPIILVNGRISDSSYRNYRRFRFFFREIFSLVSYFAMQSGDDEAKLRDMGVDARRIIPVGNLKFDQAQNSVQQRTPRDLSDVMRICCGRKVFIAGSTHKGEEEAILSELKKLLATRPSLFVIIAPRNPDRADGVKAIASRLGFLACKRTELGTLPSGISLDAIVLDTLGELSSLYGLAVAGFVGGSLVPERGHNILEVAAHAKPVFFGPHIDDFAEAARALSSRGGGFLVNSAEELVSRLDALLADEESAKRHGENGFRIVEENRGAVDRAVDLISRALGEVGKK